MSRKPMTASEWLGSEFDQQCAAGLLEMHRQNFADSREALFSFIASRMEDGRIAEFPELRKMLAEAFNQIAGGTSADKAFALKRQGRKRDGPATGRTIAGYVLFCVNSGMAGTYDEAFTVVADRLIKNRSGVCLTADRIKQHWHEHRSFYEAMEQRWPGARFWWQKGNQPPDFL